jgi:hypothetical protein
MQDCVRACVYVDFVTLNQGLSWSPGKSPPVLPAPVGMLDPTLAPCQLFRWLLVVVVPCPSMNHLWILEACYPPVALLLPGYACCCEPIGQWPDAGWVPRMSIAAAIHKKLPRSWAKWGDSILAACCLVRQPIIYWVTRWMQVYVLLHRSICVRKASQLVNKEKLDCISACYCTWTWYTDKRIK